MIFQGVSIFYIISLYIIGMVFGFFLAAYKKNVWWFKELNDIHLPFLITILWFVVLPVYFVIIICAFLFKKYYSLLNKTSDYFESFKNQHAKPTLSSVKEGYRTAAPKTCNSCGAPTSVVINNV